MPKRSPEAQAWHKLYNSRQWRAVRAAQLRREPMCRFCEKDGKITVATVADHVTAHKGDLVLFWDPENLQSLCQACHSGRKLNIEQRGYDNTIGADGYPVDERHPFRRGET